MKLTMLTAETLDSYTPTIRIFEGRQHLVAPVIILVEGVHAGSLGPVFYSADELSTHPSSWNGVPVTIHHPSDEEGRGLSAGHPEVMDEFMVGRLFNTIYDPSLPGLRSEIWVDIQRCSQLSMEALATLQKGQPLEVSTGLWFDDDGTPGEWSGEEFQFSAGNFRPDHLALLPGSVGACSIQDGCGVRNEEESKMEGIWGKVKSLTFHLLGLNKAGFSEVMTKLQGLVDALDKDVPGGRLIHYLVDAFDDGSFIMQQVGGPDGRRFYQGSFLKDDEGMPTDLAEDFTEVEERREFVPAGNEEGDGRSISNGASWSKGNLPCESSSTQEVDIEVETINKEESEMKAKETLVSTLIACGKVRWSENDREYLMTQEMEMLEKLQPADEVIPPVEEPAVELSADEWVKDAPSAVRDMLEDGLRLHREKRTSLIGTIMTAKGNSFTEEQLDSKDTSELEAISNLTSPAPAEGEGEGEGEGDGTGTSGAPAEEASGEGGEGEPTGNEGVKPLELPTAQNYQGSTAPPSNTEGEAVEPLARPTLNDQVGDTTH